MTAQVDAAALQVQPDVKSDVKPDVEEVSVEKTRKHHTLGHVRLRHHETNEIILIPTPSNDPNDPLNWSQPYKKYMAFIVCLAMMMCNFLAAGKFRALMPGLQVHTRPPVLVGFVLVLFGLSRPSS